MSEQILSQVEVDALLKGLSNGDIKTEGKKAEKVEGVRPYDFINQERVIRSKMPALEMVNTKFSRDLRGSVFNFLRKTVDVAQEGIESMKYEDFLTNLHVPTSLNVFQLTPLRGQGLLILEPNLVFYLVDSYFGGTGRFHTRIEGRDFTKVEQMVIKKLVELIFKDLKKNWEPVYPIEFTHVRSEMNPQFVNIIGHNELVVVSTFRLEIEAATEKFYLCLPYSAIEPIKDILFGMVSTEAREVDAQWKKSLVERFNNVPVDIATELGRADISVAQLLNLSEGDVIQLDTRVKEPLQVLVEGVPKFLAKPGVFETNYALEVLGVIDQGG